MAKRIQLKAPKFLGDCKKVQKIFKDRGYDITLVQASVLWEKYSAEMLSGWLCLIASDDHIFNSVKEYWREANSTAKILDDAARLIEDGTHSCLFEAIAEAVGPTWNGGFGTGEDRVESPIGGHRAYVAARLAVNELHHQQTLMGFSEKASKKAKLSVLEDAKTRVSYED